MRIGLISDTHGQLRPEALAFLEGCDHVVHAGDIGKPEVLSALEAIAPVTAIRGNVDTGEWAAELPEVREVTLAGVRLLVLHDLKQLGGIRRRRASGWWCRGTRTSRWLKSAAACSTSILAARGHGASGCPLPQGNCWSPDRW